MKKFIFLFIVLLVPAIIFAQGGDGDAGGGLWTVISAVFAVVTTVFGVAWKKVKSKLGKVAKLGKEGMDVVNSAIAALEDDNVTKDEVVKIKKEGQEFIAAWKDLTTKSTV